MTNYYTPSLDEFFNGLDFEYNKNGKWQPLKYHTSFEFDFDILKSRIKYLDESDILELGFRYESKVPDGKMYIIEAMSTMSIEYYQLILKYIDSEPYVSLYSSNRHSVIFSSVNIKNIFELKWLLTRYGVV